jgi:hypothetical protein
VTPPSQEASTPFEDPGSGATISLAGRAEPFIRWVLVTLSLAFLGAFLVWCFIHPRYEGDTIAGVRGADAARACLADGPLTDCPGVSYFPLFQYLPAMALGAVGVSDTGILRTLAAISTVCLAGILLLGWWIVRRHAGGGPAAIVATALAAGPLIWYARATFGEMLATFLMLLFIEAVLSQRRPLTLAVTLWLAGITKETTIPFLLVLGLVALFGPARARIRAVRYELIALAAGAVLVLATNAGFNLFRFDSIWNEYNLQSLFRVPGHGRRAEIALSIWAAPNGGLLEFWPLAVILIAITLAWALSVLGTRLPPWPALILVGVVAWLTVGFAIWYAPFGWHAWGPRLEVPWIPVLLVLATVLYPYPARTVAQWVGASVARRAAAGLVAAVIALPHLAALFGPDPLDPLFGPDSVCPAPVIIQQVTASYWYGCFHHEAWDKAPVLLEALRSLGRTDALAFALLLSLSSVAALFLAPLAGVRQEPARAPDA